MAATPYDMTRHLRWGPANMVQSECCSPCELVDRAVDDFEHMHARSPKRICVCPDTFRDLLYEIGRAARYGRGREPLTYLTKKQRYVEVLLWSDLPEWTVVVDCGPVAGDR